MSNQLLNPCFDGPHNGDPLDWQQTPGWDVSAQKNPCGENGTAARLNKEERAGEAPPDTDEYLWQVVPGNGPSLVAEMRMVEHRAKAGEYRVYGGASASGPWVRLWTPFTLADFDGADSRTWGSLLHAELDLPTAYLFYKVELYGNRGSAGALKYTAAYFESR